MNPEPILSLDGLKALAADPEFERLAAALIVAQTVAQATKERVEKYVRVVFDMFEFLLRYVGTKTRRPAKLAVRLLAE